MNGKTLLFGGILVVVIIIIIILFNNRKPAVDENEKKLEALQQKFDSLAMQITSYKDSLKKYDAAISDLKLHDSELTGKLEYNKSLQNQLKSEYAKIPRIDNFKSNDITRYFADTVNYRYQ